MQESAQKDVEQCFGVLQARFAIVKGASRFWNENDMANIMKTCVILHNMIVEHERANTALDYEYDGPFRSSVGLSNDTSPAFDAFLRRYHAITIRTSIINLETISSNICGRERRFRPPTSFFLLPLHC